MLCADFSSARLANLAQRFGTPLYVYSAEAMAAQHHLLIQSLPDEFELLYALKANPLIAVARRFMEAGCGAEVASEGELRRARAAGYAPQKVVYTCPGKTTDAMELAVKEGVACITLESQDEADRLEAVARRLSTRVSVAVRVNPAPVRSSAELAMTGATTQFGVDEEQASQFCTGLSRRCPSLSLVGVHLYTGTQIVSARQVLADARRGLELGLHLSVECDFELRFIDIGGGFGVAYADDGLLDLNELRSGYAELWEQIKHRVQNARVLVESGRFLTATAGVFVTEVLSRKESRGTTFIVCDGGYSHHPSALYIARTGRNRYPVTAITRSGGDRERVTVVGPSGTPLDVLARNVELERVQAGDLIAVGASGAYGYTNSCLLFFSGPSPAEVMIEADDVKVMRARGDLSDRQFL